MPTMQQARPSTPAASRYNPANDELAVLLVNEKTDILDEVAALLRRRGLPVVVVGGAAEARQQLASQPGIGVVVADVGLLEGDGLELAAEVLASTRPSTAVELLLIAGYQDDRSGPLLDRLGVLREPLTRRSIEQAIHQALGRAVVRRTLLNRLAD
jgi:DNA-binding NtrC family response regulator